MGWPFAELVAYASRNSRVVPGDVLGSGTAGNGGCLAELWGRRGEITPPATRAGDEVVMRVEGIGEIRNVVGDPVDVPADPTELARARADATGTDPAQTPRRLGAAHAPPTQIRRFNDEFIHAARRAAATRKRESGRQCCCSPAVACPCSAPCCSRRSCRSCPRSSAIEPGSAILVPMIVAIPALMIAIFAPFAGQIVDRLGRKTLLIVAMIAYAFVGTAPAYLESLQLILVTRVGVGITEAAIMTVCTTLIVDYFHEEKRRNKYLGLQTVVTTLAATVFIILGGALGVRRLAHAVLDLRPQPRDRGPDDLPALGAQPSGHD